MEVRQAMTTKDNHAVTIDNSTGMLEATHRQIHLKTADQVRLEIASVYRDMRLGRVDISDGTKLAYVLNILNKSIETGVIEARMESLERILKDRKT
jgi:hypothetical protein